MKKQSEVGCRQILRILLRVAKVTGVGVLFRSGGCKGTFKTHVFRYFLSILLLENTLPL